MDMHDESVAIMDGHLVGREPPNMRGTWSLRCDLRTENGVPCEGLTKAGRRGEWWCEKGALSITLSEVGSRRCSLRPRVCRQRKQVACVYCVVIAIWKHFFFMTLTSQSQNLTQLEDTRHSFVRCRVYCCLLHSH